jgi:shikimate kinase
MKKIILSGYMGSGKSIVAACLQQKIGLPLFDLDTVIEAKTNQSVAEIFATKGEVFFRKLEHEALKEILANPASYILSLGGGTPCYANNHELLQKVGIEWIYLKASPETLVERLIADTQKRPLLDNKSHDDLQTFIAQHLFERSYFYNQAKYKIATDGKSPDAIATEIQKILA